MTTHAHTHTHTHTHTHIQPCLSTHSHAHKHTLYIYLFINLIQELHSNIEMYWNHRYIDTDWIFKSDWEYLTHSHCNISSYSISCFSTQIWASVAVWLKAYILFYREHSQPQLLQNLPSLVLFVLANVFLTVAGLMIKAGKNKTSTSVSH